MLADGARYNFQQGAIVGHFDIRQLARSLARIERFVGHGLESVSVARHSLCVMYAVSQSSTPGAAVHGLLHDAHEAFVGDVSTPLKRALSGSAAAELRDLADAAQRAIYRVLDLEEPREADRHAVARADFAATVVEFQRKFMPREDPARFQWTHVALDDALALMGERDHSLRSDPAFMSDVMACRRFYVESDPTVTRWPVVAARFVHAYLTR